MAVLALVLALGACARSGPPAPVVDRSGAIHQQASRQPLAPAQAPQRARQERGPAPVERTELPRGTPAPVTKVTARAGRSRPETGRVFEQTEARVTVDRGDTLYSIARHHKVPLRTLIEANGLKPPYRLKTGDQLRIPAVRVYVVAEGDTVYALSRRFGISAERIIRENGIKGAGDRLVPTQKLLLPQQPLAATAAARPVPRAKAAEPPSQAEPAVRAIPVVARADRAIRPSSPPPRSGTFLWPLQGKVLSSYGAKGGGLFNDGINIAAEEGAPVRAAENGIVAYAGNELRGYGNLLLIRHSDGWVSAYAHNSRLLVGKGEVVRRGQTIARVGRSGGVKRSQLHFELRRGPKAVDPIRHLTKGESS